MTAIDELLARARGRIDGDQSSLAAANLRELGLRRGAQKTRKRSRGRYTGADA